MSDIRDMLKSLYDNPNISIGAHGTKVIKDPERKFVKKILEKGVMNRYSDLRRTVNLQDRGHIHSHGDIDFESLLHYDFHKHDKGYAYEMVHDPEKKLTRAVIKEVELEQCTFLFGIPKDLSVQDIENLYSGPLQEFDREYASNETELRVGTYCNIKGRPIDPKYVIGYYMDGDISTAVLNEGFYGFSRDENGELVIDEEKIIAENERIKALNAKKATITGQELGKETMTQQKDVEAKEKSRRLFASFLEKRRNKDDKERSAI